MDQQTPRAGNTLNLVPPVTGGGTTRAERQACSRDKRQLPFHHPPALEASSTLPGQCGIAEHPSGGPPSGVLTTPSHPRTRVALGTTRMHDQTQKSWTCPCWGGSTGHKQTSSHLPLGAEKAWEVCESARRAARSRERTAGGHVWVGLSRETTLMARRESLQGICHVIRET